MSFFELKSIAEKANDEIPNTSNLKTDLATKINKEVNLAINTALIIRKHIPESRIEIHVDIGLSLIHI